MSQGKLFEVTLKYFICAEDKESAEEEMLRIFGVNYASIELKEIKAGFRLIALVPQVGLDEIPY